MAFGADLVLASPRMRPGWADEEPRTDERYFEFLLNYGILFYTEHSQA
jgi:hypothetical protein